MTAPGGVIATAFVRVLSDTRDFAANLRKSLKKSSRELRIMDREVMMVQRSFANLGKFATGIVPGIQATTMAFKAMAAHAVVGGIVSLAGALGVASGALLTLPAAGVAAASVMGALAIGLSGVKDTLKHFSDPEKFAEDLKGLSKNARQTLGVLSKFRGQIDDLKSSVQDRLFAGLKDTFSGLLSTFLPKLQTHFGNLADTINGAGKDLGAFLQTGQTMADIDTITSNTEISFRNLRAALIPAATAFRDIAVVGSGFLPILTTEVTKLSIKFADFIAKARATGQLKEWISQGIAALKQIFQILGNVGRAIGGVMSAASASGVTLLGTLVKLTDAVADFTTSSRGRVEIQAFLQSARNAGEALLPVVLAIGDAFFNHLFPVLESIGTAVGPAATKFIQGIGNAITIAAPGIHAFAQGFASFITAITPVLPMIGTLIGELGELVGVLAAKLGPAIADVASAIGSILMPIINALTAVFEFLPSSVLKIVVVLVTMVAIVGALITVVRTAQIVMALFAGGLQGLTAGGVKATGGLKGIATFLGGPWGIAIGLATTALGLFMSKSDDTAGAVSSLSTAIESSADSAAVASREWVRQKLEQEGVADTAEKLGVSMNELIGAYMGTSDATHALSRTYVENANNTDITREQYLAYIAALESGPAVIDGARGAQDRKTETDRDGLTVTSLAIDLLNIQKIALSDVTNALKVQQEQQLASLNAELGWQNQLATTTEALGKGARTLDSTNQIGRDHLQTLSELAAAGIRRVEQLKNEKAATDVINTTMAANKEAILALLDPFFQSREAARQFAVQVGLIERDPTVTPVVNDTAARDKLKTFESYIEELVRPRTINFFAKIANMANPGGLLGAATPIPGNAAGGPVGPGQWTWVGEKGPELVRFGQSARIFSNSESNNMARDVGSLDLMTSSGGSGQPSSTRSMSGGGGTATATVNVTTNPVIKVYVGDREITDIVRVELTERDKQLARVINAGTGRRR